MGLNFLRPRFSTYFSPQKILGFHWRAFGEVQDPSFEAEQKDSSFKAEQKDFQRRTQSLAFQSGTQRPKDQTQNAKSEVPTKDRVLTPNPV